MQDAKYTEMCSQLNCNLVKYQFPYNAIIPVFDCGECSV